MILHRAHAYRVRDDEDREGWVILRFLGYLGNDHPMYDADVFVYGCERHYNGTDPNGPRGGLRQKDGERARKGIAELCFAVAVEDIAKEGQ